ncbi:MAG: hypothetical protein WCF92_03050 [bacterium]
MKSSDIKNKINIEVEKVKKFFANINNPEPDRDWVAIMFFFTVFFVIILVWSIALYFLYFPTTPTPPEIKNSYSTIDEKKLSGVLSAYEERKKRTEDLEKNPPIFVDPSI